jgi:hypothetical protein
MNPVSEISTPSQQFKELSDDEIEALRQRWISALPDEDDEPCSFCLWLEQVEYKACQQNRPQ